jgi:hypothetical protein
MRIIILTLWEQLAMSWLFSRMAHLLVAKRAGEVHARTQEGAPAMRSSPSLSCVVDWSWQPTQSLAAAAPRRARRVLLDGRYSSNRARLAAATA